MMIYLLGDFESDNGPGNANKQIRDSLAEDYRISYSHASSKFGRVLEMYKGVRKADILLICSKSKINCTAINLAKKLRKKIVYLMHGYASYEAVLSNPDIFAKQLSIIKKYEIFVYDASDRIVCVSKHCMEYMKIQFPQYEDKLDYIYNVVDINKIKNISQKKEPSSRKKRILSVGGGMPRKNNLMIARAISKNSDDLEYIIVGKDMEDGEKIKKYGFVTWIEHLTHEALIRMMGEADLYIQNSTFETFGLAVIEALYAGCSLLISNEVGCRDLFNTITDVDIIYDTSNEKEILEKIMHLLQEPNNKRLLNGFKEECVTKKYQCNRWHEIISGIKNEEKVYIS